MDSDGSTAKNAHSFRQAGDSVANVEVHDADGLSSGGASLPTHSDMKATHKCESVQLHSSSGNSVSESLDLFASDNEEGDGNESEEELCLFIEATQQDGASQQVAAARRMESQQSCNADQTVDDCSQQSEAPSKEEGQVDVSSCLCDGKTVAEGMTEHEDTELMDFVAPEQTTKYANENPSQDLDAPTSMQTDTDIQLPQGCHEGEDCSIDGEVYRGVQPLSEMISEEAISTATESTAVLAGKYSVMPIFQSYLGLGKFDRNFLLKIRKCEKVSQKFPKIHLFFLDRHSVN